VNSDEPSLNMSDYERLSSDEIDLAIDIGNNLGVLYEEDNIHHLA
jgi:hypothetical protein